VSAPLLELRELRTHFHTEQGIARAVDGVSFTVEPGEAVGLVGESGCGKSVTALSVMRLIQKPGKIVGGEILFEGKDLVSLPSREMRMHRGKDIAMIFQDPLTTLNPVIKVGEQIVESMIIHHGKGMLASSSLRQVFSPTNQIRLHREARGKAVEMMEQVGIPLPAQRLEEYPHQFSGGMRQRVMIAIALACNPKLLLADEPTTALDVTIQAQILDLMARLQEELNMSIVLITHDLGVVAQFCERVMVVYAGEVVESGRTDEVLHRPLHPYTQGLLNSLPRLGNRTHRIKPIYGLVPELTKLPHGCRFQTRCPLVFDACRADDPPLEVGTDGRQVRCFAVNP